MTNVKIVTDSSCTMEKSLRDELNIHMMPLSIMVDGVVYPDDDHLPGEKFMDMMANAKALPKTSQPPIGEFVELYDRLGEDGSEVISIHMTNYTLAFQHWIIWLKVDESAVQQDYYQTFLI